MSLNIFLIIICYVFTFTLIFLMTFGQLFFLFKCCLIYLISIRGFVFFTLLFISPKQSPTTLNLLFNKALLVSLLFHPSFPWSPSCINFLASQYFCLFGFLIKPWSFTANLHSYRPITRILLFHFTVHILKFYSSSISC